eukprot:gene202-34_t
MAEMLDMQSLCKTDTTCRQFRHMNRSHGPWRSLGSRMYQGLEIDNEVFDDKSRHEDKNDAFHEKKMLRMDWKTRYVYWRRELPKFRAPFEESTLTDVKNSDEVTYCKTRIRTDYLKNEGVYMEVEIIANADNLSFAVVDFIEGGKSSVTFSPDTGAVIKETKIQETPRKVKGWYIQPLRHIPPKTTQAMRNERFEGSMGLYIKNGKIAFFRKYAHAKTDWESTGFIIGLDWAHGSKLTPCLAFRDEGHYHVRVNKIDSVPPFEPARYETAWDMMN